MRRTQLILPQGKVYIVLLLYLYMLQERPDISGVVCVVVCVCVCVCVMNASYFKHLLPTQRPCQRMFKLPCNWAHLTH